MGVASVWSLFAVGFPWARPLWRDSLHCQKQILILGGGSLLVISLPDRVKRKGILECVQIHDAEVIKAVPIVLATLRPDEKFFP
eukprot:1856131-Pyramimonas_sp.AAC.1